MRNQGKSIQLAKLTALLREHGCHKIYLKYLAKNDNKKNQIYLGGNFTAINLIPFKEVVSDPVNPQIFKAALDFSWLGDDCFLYPAPNARLILYPQYPEVRFSGFLRGCVNPPSGLMDETLRMSGRILFLGITPEGNVIGYVCHPESPIVPELARLGILPTRGIFYELGFDRVPADNEAVLLEKLREIHLMGWIRSWRLGPDGRPLSCESTNCGGLTLEAELGIIPNSRSEPDLLGFEIKQYKVNRLDHINTGVLTLMTPEPTGGYYKHQGVEAFVRRYGHPDMSGQPGREDRLNFGGIHRVDHYHPRTGFSLHLSGYDHGTRKIIDSTGGIALVNREGEEAAVWHYAAIMKHWNRKHAQAAYIPSISENKPVRRYHYGKIVRVGKGTDFLLYLKAIAEGHIYYDPGIKLEKASMEARIKRRSQFRVKSVALSALYHEMRTLDLLDGSVL